MTYSLKLQPSDQNTQFALIQQPYLPKVLLPHTEHLFVMWIPRCFWFSIGFRKEVLGSIQNTPFYNEKHGQWDTAPVSIAWLQGQLNFTAAFFHSITFLCCFLQLLLVLVPTESKVTDHKEMTSEILLSVKNIEHEVSKAKTSP